MADKAVEENWLHYSEDQHKRKRAALVCIACHSKKIKCDLKLRKNDGKDDCSQCASSGRDCQVRPSRRDKRRKADGEITRAKSVQGDEEMPNGVDALLAADTPFQASTQANLRPGPSDVAASPHQNHISPESLHNTCIQDFQPISSPQHTFPFVSSQTETTPTQNGDINSGPLQAHVPENQYDAGSRTFVAQLEHRHSPGLPSDLEQIFTETYYTYSYPWCPVLDRGTLSSDLARSPLLANALALASSHIQPPLLPHDGPEAYYKRARSIFYNDEEADEMIALKALCLFYWWAPQSPSKVHRHSSWYILHTLD